MNKGTLSWLFTGVLMLGALIIMGMALHKGFKSYLAPAPNTPSVRLVDAWEGFAEEGHRVGSQTAPVQIIKFYDYQCPFCSRVDETLARIREIYSEEVAVIYRHYPLIAIHPQAYPAAIAAECAADQGRFAPYHEILYENQAFLRLPVVKWDSLAQVVGVGDLQRFQNCLVQPQSIKRIETDIKAARQLEVSGTPTLLVNGRMVTGSISLEQLERLVKEALEESRS